VSGVGGRGIEHADDRPLLVELADVELARLGEPFPNHVLDQSHSVFAPFVPRKRVSVDAFLDDEHDPPSLRPSHFSDDLRDRREEIVWMTPDIDVASAVLLRERDPDQAVGVTELDTGDERRAAFRVGDRLLALEPEPVADASAKELRDVCPLRLVPAKARLEIARTGSPVLEQAVKRQPSRGQRHGDRCLIR
jgi:hypothetical protein